MNKLSATQYLVDLYPMLYVMTSTCIVSSLNWEVLINHEGVYKLNVVILGTFALFCLVAAICCDVKQHPLMCVILSLQPSESGGGGRVADSEKVHQSQLSAERNEQREAHS